MDKIARTKGKKVQIPTAPTAYFWYVSKSFKGWMFGAIFVVIIASGFSQSSAYFFKLIVDAVENDNYESALLFALLYPVIILVTQLLYRLSGFLGRDWVINVEKRSTDVLFKYVTKHSHNYFTNRFAGSLISKIGNVNNAVLEIIPVFLWTHLNSLVSLIVTFVFLLFVDVGAAMVFVFLVVTLIVFNQKMSPKKLEYSKATALAKTKLRGRVVDVITNMQAVRQFVQADSEEVFVAKLSQDAKMARNKNWGYTEKTLLLNGLILFAFSFVMFGLLVYGWDKGQVSTGNLVLILVLFSQIAGNLIFIGRAFNNTAKTIGEMNEGLEELLLPIEIIDASNAKPLVIIKGDIDWNKVSFEFEEQSVFDNFDLHIQPGQKIGLVGESGAGKSTFVSLLLRQHEIKLGSIFIDGQDISLVTQDSLRKAISVVPQEPALFHRSIRENILYGNQNATEEELVEVTKKAFIYDFIMSLPNGFETMVGERGVKLSGGQKQRVAIARAMLKDSPILILDEATSALDSKSEVSIQAALDTLMENRTVIAIAHRLSTLRKMDRIVVLDKGRVVEDGNHESLSQAGGTYEKLWKYQAEGFWVD